VNNRRNKLPETEHKFQNEFLASSYAGFTKRLKSLRYKGDIRFEFDSLEPLAWFNIRCELHHCIILTIDSGHRAIVVIRTLKGKNIFALRRMVIVDNVQAIINAFELTTSVANCVKINKIDAESRNKLIQIWRGVTLRIVME
jgi:hypothetical protein